MEGCHMTEASNCNVSRRDLLEAGVAAGVASLRSPTATRPRRSCRSRLADRKSTRLNSSHGYISYAVFCLKKKIHGVGKAVGDEAVAHQRRPTQQQLAR